MEWAVAGCLVVGTACPWAAVLVSVSSWALVTLGGTRGRSVAPGDERPAARASPRPPRRSSGSETSGRGSNTWGGPEDCI